MMTCVNVEDEYRRHVAALVHFAAVLVGPDDAMDVVNEAVTGTLARRSLESVRDVRAYWFRAVTFTAASWHRSRLRRHRREDRFQLGAVVADPGRAELGEAIRVLATLSVQQRSVTYLAYWLDWDVARIAAVLGVSQGTVRKQLGRARARLREELSDGEL